MLRSDVYSVEQERITKQEIIAMQHFVNTRIARDEVVVGGRSPMTSFYFYILGENYYRAIPPLGKTPEENFVTSILLRSTSSTGVSVISTPYFFRLSPASQFIAFFQSAFKYGWLDKASHVWFFDMENANEFVTEQLPKCKILQPEIDNMFVTEKKNVMLFSLKTQTIRELISPQGKYFSCLKIKG